MLRQTVSDNAQRLNTIDHDGTRGVGVLQQQITEVVRDLAELKTETSSWQSTHTQQHEAVQKERRETRRWVFGFAVAALASLGTIGGLLFEILSRLH